MALLDDEAAQIDKPEPPDGFVTRQTFRQQCFDHQIGDAVCCGARAEEHHAHVAKGDA